LTKTRLAQVILCNKIYYITTYDSVRNAQLKSFKLITQIEMYPNTSHQSYTFGGCGLNLASMMVRFVMYDRNRSYTSEGTKLTTIRKTL
jgi:hypothetical protein